MTSTAAPAAYRKFEDGAKVTAPRCVQDGADWTYRARTATVVSYTPWDPAARSGDYYTVRFADGTEDTASERDMRAAKPARPKGERRERNVSRAGVTKPDPKTLPRVLYYLDRVDSGEYGNATCPHCGADGRYVYRFVCDDGHTHGAMAGCVKLYPRSPLADEHQRLMDRMADRDKAGKGLASWDQAKLAAIEEAARGDLTEAEAMLVVKAENAKRSAWMSQRNRGRR